jgi:hypothetical protein
MLKKLTLFCTFAIFMLAVGGVVTPLQAHCPEVTEDNPDPVHSGDHPHCRDEPTDDQLYNVKITGYINGVGDNWGAGQKQIGFNFSNSAGPNGQLSNLVNFRLLFGNDGITCFPDDPIDISSVILEKHKRGTAKALIWFWAYTREPGNTEQYLYHLELNGLFDEAKDWPPLSSNILKMTEWSTHLGNEGNTIKNISCLSSGDTGDTGDDTNFNGIDIEVTLD